MEQYIMSADNIHQFGAFLLREEKSRATREKYLRDVRSFFAYTGGRPVTKELVIAYKAELLDRQYAVRSVNSMLAAINNFLTFLGWTSCRVKAVRVQRQTYAAEDKELTKAEYLRLLEAASGDEQLKTILQTICGTGIRVSELQYFTVEAVRRGKISVHCKSKIRTILIPGMLRKVLLAYVRNHHIRSGCIFCNRLGKPLDRSSIWRRMKHLCRTARVQPSKVFPHNLRRLFARIFYSLDKDIAKLADLLGHSSIETTRIYIMSTGTEHRRKLERMGLILNTEKAVT